MEISVRIDGSGRHKRSAKCWTQTDSSYFPLADVDGGCTKRIDSRRAVRRRAAVQAIPLGLPCVARGLDYRSQKVGLSSLVSYLRLRGDQEGSVAISDCSTHSEEGPE